MRSVQHARELHEQHKRELTMTVREAIKSTLILKGELHADDLAELEIPEEHSSIIGSQIARLVNQKLIVAVGRRRCEHPAANGRKANVYQATPLGSQKLAAGVDVANREGTRRNAPPPLDRPDASGARSSRDVDPSGPFKVRHTPPPYIQAHLWERVWDYDGGTPDRPSVEYWRRPVPAQIELEAA